ncbi:MAG: flagellar protein, partial [Stutzerimonas stutzeri]
MTSKADSLNGLLDGMSNGIQTIKAADKALESISKSLSTLKGIVNSAKADAGQINNTLSGANVVSYSTALT